MPLKSKKILSVFLLAVLLAQLFLCAAPPARAEIKWLYPNQYTYVKPAPYWTCDPCDEIPASVHVAIIERDYDFFYIEYMKDNILKRGYAPMTSFNAADYNGYDWCDHPVFTPARNITGGAVTTYYGAHEIYGVSGSIDADEGIHANKPLMILKYWGDYAFIQYVTNPAESGHVKFKRAWVFKNTVTTLPPNSTFQNETYTLIKNPATGKYLQSTYDSSAPYNYRLTTGDPTGHANQQWILRRLYTAEGGYYYKLENAFCGLVIEIQDKIPVVGNNAILVTENEPNKAQHFTFNQIAGSTYKILSRCSGNFLALQNGANITQERISSSSNQNWTFEPLNKYWSLSYNSLTYSEGKAVISYYINTSSTNGIGVVNITADQVTSAISNWNNAGAAVSLKRVYSASSAKIRIRTIQADDADYFGYTEQHGGLSNNDNWDYCIIYFNSSLLSNNPVPNFTINQKTKLICHEVGHALKLEHPYGTGINGLVVYSVMCQGLFGSHNRINMVPSAYDIQTLKNKWGK